MTALLHHGLGPPSTVTVEQRLPNGRLLVRFPNGGTMIVPAPLTEPSATHAGYGATRRTTHRSCPDCGWWIETEATEVRP